MEGNHKKDELKEEISSESSNQHLDDENIVNEEDSEEIKNDSHDIAKIEDEKDKKIEEYKELLKRNRAEFENYRKRTEKEKAQIYEVGAKTILEKFLPVIDNFERALESVSDDEKDRSFVQGVEKIYKQLFSVLEEVGVSPVESVGETFDPKYHNAVMHDEDENFDENIVSEEYQKGYVYKDIVLRPSMVKVVN